MTARRYWMEGTRFFERPANRPFIPREGKSFSPSEVVLAEDHDAAIAQLEARCEQEHHQAEVYQKELGLQCHAVAQARGLLSRCLTELDGNEMDKVRGALVAEARAWMGEGA